MLDQLDVGGSQLSLLDIREMLKVMCPPLYTVNALSAYRLLALVTALLDSLKLKKVFVFFDENIFRRSKDLWLLIQKEKRASERILFLSMIYR